MLKPCIVKKRKNILREGISTSPYPTSDTIFIGRVLLGDSRNFRDLEIIPYPDRGLHSGGAGPRERDWILE
jgi:hypothetical protein